MSIKVLVSPSSFGQVSARPIDLLKYNGYDVIVNHYGRKLTEPETIDLGQNCLGIIAGVENLNASVLHQLPELKCISRVGVGIDNIDLEYAKKNGIIVLNTPEGPTQSVVELTLGVTLSLLRRIPQADSDMKSKIWKKQTGSLLFGKKIGIVGLGRIGKAVSKQFISLGNKVLGFDLKPDTGWAKNSGVELMSLEEVVAGSDIITLHIPCNKDKKPIIDSMLLYKMKNSAYLINLSRGGVVDEEALFTLLNKNKIAGAAIDVFLEEPYQGPLCELDNVILTPHIGSYAREGKLQMEIDAVNNLINALKGFE